MKTFEDEFLQGQKDCEAGKAPQSIETWYTRGYQTQYESEQALTWFNEQQEKNIERPPSQYAQDAQASGPQELAESDIPF
jgi:hypothetical protein